MNQSAIALDPGLTAVDLLYKQMMIDEEWSVRHDRGFSWWSYRLAQHVEASEPFTVPDGSTTACQLRIWTDIATEVPNDGSKISEIMAMANMYQTLSAVVWDGSNHTISECCTSPVYAETVESRTQVLSVSAIMQNYAAHSRARAMVEVVGGCLGESNHPVSGERAHIDDILNVPSGIIAPKGAETSAFAGGLMERLSGEGSPLSELSVLTTGDANGLTAEFPYAGPRPAIELAAIKQPPETALLQVMTDQRHPELGSGALVTLKLPKTGQDDAGSTANALNLLEAIGKDTIEFSNGGTARTTLLGAWCVDPSRSERDSLAFVSFVPSIVAKDGVLENLCIYNAVRTRWAHSVLND